LLSCLSASSSQHFRVQNHRVLEGDVQKVWSGGKGTCRKVLEEEEGLFEHKSGGTVKWLELLILRMANCKECSRIAANGMRLGCCIDVFLAYTDIAHVNEFKGGPKLRCSFLSPNANATAHANEVENWMLAPVMSFVRPLTTSPGPVATWGGMIVDFGRCDGRKDGGG
jgi:hypothetical protein